MNNKREFLIKYLEENYNIYSSEELERELKNIVPINMAILTK